MLIVRLAGRIFEFETLMGDVPEVTVTAVRLVDREGQVNAMCFGIVDLILTRLHVPLIIPPGSNDLDIRSQSLDAQLKTNLVVTLTGSAVADGNRILLAGNLN